MSDEPIPLWDGEMPDAKIIPDKSSLQAPTAGTVRSKRVDARHTCDRVHVCFSPQLPSGRTEHVECPVVDISKGGVAIEFDARLEPGVSGIIEYRTVSQSPVRVTGRVKRCGPMDNGHYLIGFRFDRSLRYEELRPAKTRPGKPVVPELRPRKLKTPLDAGMPKGGEAAPEESHSESGTRQGIDSARSSHSIPATSGGCLPFADETDSESNAPDERR